MAVVLTLVQTKEIRINKHKRNNKKTVQTIQNSKYEYTYYQNTHTLQTHPPHTHTHPHITKQVKTTTVQDTHQMK